MQPKKQLKVQYIGSFEEIDSFYRPNMHFLKKGQKIRAWVDPPSFGQCPKENVFFVLMSSLFNSVSLGMWAITMKFGIVPICIVTTSFA